MLRPSLLLSTALPIVLFAQVMNPMAVPPALELDTFDLDVDEHVVNFYPGVNTSTYGASAPYLGPTLILHQGDSARIRVHNHLSQVTSMHWHGMRVPGWADGGPPREVLPGETWSVEFPVRHPAATFWYHPHPDGLTAEQANLGVAGTIVVRDTVEAALDLPRNYGVDDLPVVIQDRRFAPNGNFVFAAYGDSVLVNGTPHAYVDCPAQVVRLRLLNGSNARVYQLGFDDGRTFHVIAGDGGLLSAPVPTDRLPLSNGERAEVLLDLTGMEGDSLHLMSFGSELPVTVPGANNPIWESSVLNGVDFQVLRIRVGPPTPGAVTAIPGTLVTLSPPDEADAVRTRTKILAGMGMVGMGMFTINGLMFDPAVVNDTMLLGTAEVWEIENISNMAHPMHLHGGSFFILDRDGAPPAAWEAGPKDVVLVDAGASVRIIMRFEDLSDGWPYMYHCHNLMHEDNMMMLQYIVVDTPTGMPAMDAAEASLFPVPSTGQVNYACTFVPADLRITDGTGRIVHQEGPVLMHGSLHLSLPRGSYIATFSSHHARTSAKLIIQ
ncbi:MAG TPA: multicopper oxidase domain-containing protein [Flavobacteriales bacterium]|nr:multicopper oxidase domain-containing protein [Flavobacteriales bacterium]HMR27473.1 multicopper oxidase domain-containing protein [Flavobacteriales bacterium]